VRPQSRGRKKKGAGARGRRSARQDTPSLAGLFVEIMRGLRDPPGVLDPLDAELMVSDLAGMWCLFSFTAECGHV
jgi:hypothetical protein